MTQLIGFIVVLLGLPVVLALGVKGWERYRRRAQAVAVDPTGYFGDAKAEASARALLAWCEARQARERAGGVNGADNDCQLSEGPNYMSRRAFERSSFRYMIRHGIGEQPSEPTRDAGFARVELHMSDGTGRQYTVERKLCLN